MAGTPTLRLAFWSPPTAKIQLPKRVLGSAPRTPTVVKTIHQMIATVNDAPANVMVLAKTACGGVRTADLVEVADAAPCR